MQDNLTNEQREAIVAQSLSCPQQKTPDLFYVDCFGFLRINRPALVHHLFQVADLPPGALANYEREVSNG